MTRILPPLIPSLLLLATVWLQTASAALPATDPVIYPSRVSPPPSPAGVHPRVLLSPDEMPALLNRLHNTPAGKSALAISVKAVEQERALLETLAALQHRDLRPEYQGKETPGKGPLVGQHLPGERSVVSRDGVIEPQFKVLILPFSEGEALPVLEWQSKDTFGVRWPGGGAEEIGAVVDEKGRSNLVLH